MPASVLDVAQAAGVSVGTVSNYLNKPSRVAPKTRERVQAAIDKVGFVRNEAARSLRAGSNTAIGLVVLDITNPFFAELARGAEDRASEDSRIILVANTAEQADREERSLNQLAQQRVSGVVLSPLHSSRKRIDRLIEFGIDVVLVDQEAEEGFLPSVSVDHRVGGQLATQHLIDIGCRHIAFVGGPSTIRQVADRLSGAEHVVARTPQAVLNEFRTLSLSIESGREVGVTIAALSSRDRPEAVFCANDLLAFGVLQSLRRAGIAVPRDIAVIGYDDISFAQWLEVPLTSIRQPAYMLGNRAVDLLLSADITPESVRFEPELIKRATTSPNRNA